jgi:hypothetical protein
MEPKKETPKVVETPTEKLRRSRATKLRKLIMRGEPIQMDCFHHLDNCSHVEMFDVEYLIEGGFEELAPFISGFTKYGDSKNQRLVYRTFARITGMTPLISASIEKNSRGELFRTVFVIQFLNIAPPEALLLDEE